MRTYEMTRHVDQLRALNKDALGALTRARQHGWRTNCLRASVEALGAALRTAAWELEEACEPAEMVVYFTPDEVEILRRALIAARHEGALPREQADPLVRQLERINGGPRELP